MEVLLKEVKKYIYETLKVMIEVRSWKSQSNLPFFLSDTYHFYETEMFNQTYLLMIASESEEITPGTVQKHQEQVKKKWSGPIIFVQSVLSSYDRKRLIEHHIPFIIPGNQMYLPDCGIDLREHFRKLHAPKNSFFSPSTQAAVIYALLNGTSEKLTPSLLAEKLGYTLMTMTRAFNELKDVGEFQREGRERYWIISDKQCLWNDVKSFLRTPVKKRVWVKKHSCQILAGLSALSSMSHLAPPIMPVYAIGSREWEKLKQVEEIPSADKAVAELEIWNYNPLLFAHNNLVDPFSLYCSLAATTNERIESSLNEVMEKIKW